MTAKTDFIKCMWFSKEYHVDAYGLMANELNYQQMNRNKLSFSIYSSIWLSQIEDEELHMLIEKHINHLKERYK